jgi:alcohol dehydrogenase class IV
MSNTDQMSALQRLALLEARVERMNREPGGRSRRQASKAHNYPRRLDEEATKCVVDAYNSLCEQLIIPMTVTQILEEARRRPGGESVPSGADAPTVLAIIAEHHGIQVSWSAKEPMKSIARTEDLRVLSRRRD